MAIIRSKKLKDMGEKEMGEKLRELKLELSKDRASSEIGTVKNPGRIREIRRSIARMLHEQRRREIAAKNIIKVKTQVAAPAKAAAKTDSKTGSVKK